MKADRLTALQMLCDLATAAPWWIDMDSREGGADQILYGAGLAICFMTSDGNWDDSEFISKARTALPECLAHILELQLQVDANRRALGQEICEGLKVRGYWAPADTSSSDIIGAVFQVIDKQHAEIESLQAALEATGNAMNVLGIKEMEDKIQRAVEIYRTNPTGPAAVMMHKALTEGGA